MSYNGWTNWETWNLNLWRENEYSSYMYWRDIALEIAAESDNIDDAQRELGDRLSEAYHEELDYTVDEMSGWLADFVSRVLDDVNWYEIAEYMLTDDLWEEAHKEDDEEEDDD